ncbi:EAL domain-containing protein [Bradyrhizobium sp.]|uniref:EAL domain-containing protein n=1 Tax=Bradyrhizobium sp. TaxID=376 RepID=UPI0025C16F81|nr:EAL domain-containing protein [Bradyrhizobium sp.]
MKRYRLHLFALGVLLVIVLTGAHSALHNALADMRFGWLARQASGNVVLVAIDSPSIEKIGVWPWPRELHAQLVGRLEGAGISDVVFDVDFSSPSNSSSDQALVDALQKAGGSVVLPAFKQRVGHGKTIHVNRPLSKFEKHAWSAVANVLIEPNGLVRRYLFGETIDGKFLPSVAALLAGRHEKDEAPFYIDFGIRANSVPMVSFVDVLRGDPAVLNGLKDKKVVIGGTAVELGDRFNVPNGQIVSGPLLQVLAAESILQGRALQASSFLTALGGLVVLVSFMAVVWRRTSAGVRVVLLVGLACAIELGATLLQAWTPLILDTALFHAAIAVYLVALALEQIDILGWMHIVAERRFQRIALSVGDGLVCADHSGVVTVWNPGATAIFGYRRDEMIGQPFSKICAAGGAGKPVAFSILDLPQDELQAPGGRVMEIEGRRKNGERFPLDACFSGWHGTDGFQYGVVMRDISARRREADRMRYLAEYDTLTGLANRHTLNEYLAARLAGAKAGSGGVALLLLDLDKFKEVNDTLGHASGDQLLCAVAKQLATLVGDAGLAARLSGDEFAIVLSGADAALRAKELAEDICIVFRLAPVPVGERQLNVTGSIGVSIYPDDSGTVDQLLGNADLALYQAKAKCRGQYVFFNRTIRDALEVRRILEAELKKAVERREFKLLYQPQFNLRDGSVVGVEALIRWAHPDRGMVSPAEFMPVVNASAMSNDTAVWVLEAACMQGRLWQLKGHAVRVGVNLAPSQLQSGNLAVTVRRILTETGFAPALLELEVTENILLEDDTRAIENFRQLKELGVHIVFDDFGTGYASLSYLKKFHLDGLKIDRSFVRDLRAGSDDAAIVGSTISLGKQLGLSVIAEGIEDCATADLLLSMGCEHGQGFYLGRPMPAEEFEQKFLAAGVRLAPGRAAAGRTASAA